MLAMNEMNLKSEMKKLEFKKREVGLAFHSAQHLVAPAPVGPLHINKIGKDALAIHTQLSLEQGRNGLHVARVFGRGDLANGAQLHKGCGFG